MNTDPNMALDPSVAVSVVTIPRTDISTATTGAWVDVDVSAYVPSGAKAAIVIFNNTGSSIASGGVRKKGATDEGTYLNVGINETRSDIVQLDYNRVFQQKIGITGFKLYIVGYIM